MHRHSTAGIWNSLLLMGRIVPVSGRTVKKWSQFRVAHGTHPHILAIPSNLAPYTPKTAHFLSHFKPLLNGNCSRNSEFFFHQSPRFAIPSAPGFQAAQSSGFCGKMGFSISPAGNEVKTASRLRLGLHALGDCMRVMRKGS